MRAVAEEQAVAVRERWTLSVSVKLSRSQPAMGTSRRTHPICYAQVQLPRVFELCVLPSIGRVRTLGSVRSEPKAYPASVCARARPARHAPRPSAGVPR